MADSLPTHMTAVYLRGYGGPEMLEVVSNAPVPTPGEQQGLPARDGRVVVQPMRQVAAPATP